MTTTIRVLLVDDHAVVREGLRALIDTEDGIEVAGEAADGEQAIGLALAGGADVLLLDLMLPRKDGLQVIDEVRRSRSPLKILVLSSFAEDHHVARAVRAGADGYLLKESTPRELLRAIRDVAAGEAALAPSIARQVVRELHNEAEVDTPDRLTDREQEVLILVAGGLSNRDIADQLGISERTVRTHVGHLLAKLDLANRTQAALYAVRHGLISP